MPFDMRQLRYAIAAADYGSFYRAARALDVEQSTLSRAVVKLEHSLGTPIFRRSRSGVMTTLAGAEFIRVAKPMLATAEKLVETMRANGQGRAGGLTLGLNSSVSAGNLRATLMSWRVYHPDVEIECVEADRSVLLAGLDTGQIDIVILLGEARYDGYRCEPFWSERVLIAVAADHSLADREIVHWTDLRSERFILPEADPGSYIRDMLLGRLAQTGTPPDIELRHTSRETVLSLLGAGPRLSVVCEGSSGVRYPDVVYLPVYGEQGPSFVGYSGYWRDDGIKPPLHQFLEFVRKRFALPFDIMSSTDDRSSSSKADPHGAR